MPEYEYTRADHPHHSLETDLMAYRYCYYVLALPAIPDGEYGWLERQALPLLPENSPVHGVGSELVESYSEEVKQRAEKMLSGV